MKKALMLVIVVVTMSLTTFLTIGIVDKTYKSRIAKERIKTLPVFSFRTLNDKAFRSDEINVGPVIILFFHPECEHCKYEIKTLFKSKVETSGIQILLISNAKKEAIRNFVKENNLVNWPGLIALVDENYSFRDYFGTELVPATFIYDKSLKLVRYFQGEVRPETILKYLNKDD